ncbi:MAG: HIT family protein, partial [Bacteroidota bacterium]
MKNNPFIAKSIVKIAFAESPNFYVIYNQAPILPGHSLVIPKKEIISFRDFSDFEIVELTLLSRRAVEVLEKVFGARDFNWTIQDGEAAGQTVPHFHLHLIPRKQGDLNDPGDWYPELIDSYSGKNIDSESRVKFSQVELELI